jgi:pimeloyl-ACP methyl ester carboxylesterase
VKGIPAEIQRGAAGKIVVKIPSIAASYEGQWLINKVVGTFTQLGTSMSLNLIPGEPKLNRPQTPEGPFPYETEEVAFNNGDVVLKGTLTLPAGADRKTPVMIMVTGSGQQNRDEEIFEHKPFAVIADAFARSGIATLRYDDRGFSGYKGDINACTVEDFKNDALAGILLLRERFDKVGVIGHSEGGTIALILAAEGQADFIISLAGMAISGAETLVWQNKLALIDAGLSQEVTDEYCNLIGEALEARNNGEPLPKADNRNIPDGLKQNYLAVQAQLQTPYMSRFVSLDVRPLLDKIDCPVLALNGTKDTQVEAETNLGALRDGLPENPMNVIRSVEGLNHLFQHCTTGAANEYREIEETFALEVLEMMVSWLQF